MGYSRRLFNRVNWRVQLNVRNLLDNRDWLKQRANTAGDVTTVSLPAPRTFILSSTFTF